MLSEGWFLGSGRHIWVLLILTLLTLDILAQERPRVEIPYENHTLVLTADTIETSSGEQLVAEGSVVATFADAELKAQRLVYDPDKDLVTIEGKFEITRGKTWLQGSSAEIDIKTDTGVIYNASGFTDDELYVRAETLTKIDADTYIAEKGFLTSCQDRVPKWSFSIDKATINLNDTARIKNTLFRIKKVPVFYFPYMLFPTGKKERSSGFLLPTVGNSSDKGFQFGNRFYLVMGRSADILLRQDYYSQRGWGVGGTFRTRPNDATSLELSGEYVDDREGFGGGQVNGIGHTRFNNGFRGVADFNLVSSYLFRQTYSDNFLTATRPNELSRIFLTNNFGSASFNLLFSRDETIFPKQSVVIQTTPGIDFKLIGHRLGKTPFFMDLDSSVGGMNRSDRFVETPKISQRFDFYPRVSFSIPLFQGLRLTPTAGFRETFYSDSISEVEGEPVVVGDSVRREYFELNLVLKGWGLSKIYRNSSGSRLKHLIEPVAQYRLIQGIDNFDEVIRFDHVDAIANTNEIEYALVNRLFVKKSKGQAAREILSIKLGQKYFFDPSFGDALKEDNINQFFPLYTLTGLPYAITQRDMSPLTTTVRINPQRRFSFDVRADFDTDSGDFRNLAVSGFYWRDLFSVATTYFVTQDLVPGLGKSNQLQGRLGVGRLGRGFSASGSFVYDAQSVQFLSYLVRASYFWDCCGVSAEVRDFNLGTRQERSIRFSFFLKGIGAFGTIRRPENVY
ncbi:MAG TPA: LPS assembly protein LptD [Acidobacteriota bacterium]|nr:LPS assembly protein LptD [Acidobacteriota bacterium]